MKSAAFPRCYRPTARRWLSCQTTVPHKRQHRVAANVSNNTALLSGGANTHVPGQALLGLSDYGPAASDEDNTASREEDDGDPSNNTLPVGSSKMTHHQINVEALAEKYAAAAAAPSFSLYNDICTGVLAARRAAYESKLVQLTTCLHTLFGGRPMLEYERLEELLLERGLASVPVMHGPDYSGWQLAEALYQVWRKGRQ